MWRASLSILNASAVRGDGKQLANKQALEAYAG